MLCPWWREGHLISVETKGNAGRTVQVGVVVGWKMVYPGNAGGAGKEGRKLMAGKEEEKSMREEGKNFLRWLCVGRGHRL